MQKRGRSAPFVEPCLTALEAHHVWLHPTGVFALSAIAESCDAAASSHSSVFVPGLRNVRHILIDADGRQHVVLCANGAALQLLIEGAEVATAPVTIKLLVHGFDAIGGACCHLAMLRRILSADQNSPSLPRWTGATRMLRDALVAVDGRAAGASYHEIAVVLHGVDYVERNWRTGLKERMRRHLRRGLALSGGRYREFLR